MLKSTAPCTHMLTNGLTLKLGNTVLEQVEVTTKILWPDSGY